MHHDLETLIKNFLEYLEVEKGRSKNTVKNYHFYLTRFADFCEYPPAEKITSGIVESFRRFLKKEATQEGLEDSTQNYHLIALRSFLKYLAVKNISSLQPENIKLSKMPERRIDVLGGTDVERLLETPLYSDEPEIIKLRDKAILELLFSTGLRVSELSSLKREQADTKKSSFTMRGKGGEPRVIPLSHQVKYWLEKYLVKRTDLAPALFVRHDKAKGAQEPKNLTPRSIQRMVQKYAKLSGLTKQVTPHTLRHSFAADLFNKGTDIKTLQKTLGHASALTTQAYARLKQKNAQEEYKKLKKTITNAENTGA